MKKIFLIYTQFSLLSRKNIHLLDYLLSIIFQVILQQKLRKIIYQKCLKQKPKR
jgi:hypothetical protein